MLKGLSKAGLIVDLIYFKHGFDQDVLIERYFNTVHVFPHKIGFNFGIVLNVAYLIKIISKNQYGVVHSHTSLGGAIARLASFFFIKRKFKTIHTLHAFGADEYTKQPLWLAFYLIEKFFDLVTDKYIAPSNFTANYGLRIKLFRSEKVRVIYNSLFHSSKTPRIDCGIRSQLHITNDDLMFLLCGRLEEQRSFVLLSAWKLLVAENKTANWSSLEMAAKGKLKIFAKSNNLDDSIVFTGWSTDVDKFTQLQMHT